MDFSEAQRSPRASPILTWFEGKAHRRYRYHQYDQAASEQRRSPRIPHPGQVTYDLIANMVVVDGEFSEDVGDLSGGPKVQFGGFMLEEY
eukprot:CAMPEP_0185923966 /NCGR_PEP_ID=MMETSP0924C-20121207/11812_1 /TAXON_ID=321610 /ORGANISM="Perkinsus chesapeaki, Strain ATCC PRA-65" /LENGTH=89 /DNA_ID=CAMNT_0028658243 /DNA_START=78 /DNA_END=345 /DNA_ORIENTATION=-